MNYRKKDNLKEITQNKIKNLIHSFNTLINNRRMLKQKKK